MPRAESKLAVWFDWPDDPHGGRVEVVHLSRQDEARISEQVHKAVNVFNRESGQMETRQELNPLLDRQLTADAALRSWENFLDQDGKPMACDRENKFFWACDREFMATLNGFRAIVAQQARELAEKKEKN